MDGVTALPKHWEFVDIYADEGISGTQTKKREGFNRMIKDALDGKIDVIIPSVEEMLIEKSHSFIFACIYSENAIDMLHLNKPSFHFVQGQIGCERTAFFHTTTSFHAVISS